MVLLHSTAVVRWTRACDLRFNYLDVFQPQTMMCFVMVNDSDSRLTDQCLPIPQPGDRWQWTPLHSCIQFHIVSNISRNSDKLLRKFGFLALYKESCVIHVLNASAKLFEVFNFEEE